MQQARDAELDGFLIKPVNRSLLLDTILEILGKERLQSLPAADKSQLDMSRLSGIRGAHVLLVEDNALNQQVASELLEAAGLRVTVAENGRQGVDAALAASYDLVLMDIQMPEMDGLEAARAIRGHDQLRQLPIVAMSAHAMAGDKEKSLKAGMNGHITKPIDPDELYATLLLYIKPGERQAPEIPVRRTEESTAAGELPDFPGIDVPGGLRKVAGNVHVYLKILKGFYKDFRNASSSLRADLEEERFDEAGRAAHTIKGVAGNIGAQALFKASADLETALRKGQKDEALRLHPRFEASLTEVISGLASLDKPHGAEAGQPALPGKPDPEAARRLIAEMARLLAAGDMEAEYLMPKLREALAGAGMESSLDTMEEYIDSFDFENALTALNALESSCLTL